MDLILNIPPKKISSVGRPLSIARKTMPAQTAMMCRRAAAQSATASETAAYPKQGMREPAGTRDPLASGISLYRSIAARGYIRAASWGHHMRIQMIILTLAIGLSSRAAIGADNDNCKYSTRITVSGQITDVSTEYREINIKAQHVNCDVSGILPAEVPATCKVGSNVTAAGILHAPGESGGDYISDVDVLHCK